MVVEEEEKEVEENVIVGERGRKKDIEDNSKLVCIRLREIQS